ncbi:MAG: DNA polymerase III subunit delta' [Cyanobacteria bacterium P01_F01_bin.42]
MVSPPFAQLLGQSQAVTLLTRAIACGRIAPAYMFVGPSGIGRTLAARDFLKLLIHDEGDRPRRRQSQDNHPDILWIEPTYLKSGTLFPGSAFDDQPEKRPRARPQIRVAQVREITKFIHQAPLEASRLLVIIDQAELMGEAAANGLLKTLEEPGQASLILIANSMEALLPTIVSRCQRIPFYPLSHANLAHVLTQTGHEEILHDRQIMALAMGSPGQAIAHWRQRQAVDSVLLEQCMAIPLSDRDSLSLAREIERNLDLQSQLWLCDYLQQHFWQQTGTPTIVDILETTKRCLNQYVQPLLSWEVTWLEISDLINSDPQSVR